MMMLMKPTSHGASLQTPLSMHGTTHSRRQQVTKQERYGARDGTRTALFVFVLALFILILFFFFSGNVGSA